MMVPSLSREHAQRYEQIQAFVSQHVQPAAGTWERAERIPDAVIARVAAAGYLGGTLPPHFEGQGWDTLSFGLLNEAFGQGSSSLTDLLTVQAMVSMTLQKWGSEEQKRHWLPRLARGDVIG